jgi:hypothetical protein
MLLDLFRRKPEPPPAEPEKSDAETLWRRGFLPGWGLSRWIRPAKPPERRP